MKQEIRPLPKVYANATIQRGEVIETRAVPMFEKLPGWWARGTGDQRGLWLREYFRRALKLAPEDSLLSVNCGGA